MEAIKIVLASACILSAIHGVQSLKCLQCFSYKSMADCDSVRGSVICEAGFDRCKNTTVQVYSDVMKETLTGYELGCGKSEECQIKRCAYHFGIKMGIAKYAKCDISCCEGDLCPEGKNATYRTPRPSESPVAKGARGGGVGQVAVWSQAILLLLILASFVISL